jgi:hypothetical protein
VGLVGYAQLVAKALTEAEELAVLLDADLDLDHGGFSWWHGYGLDLGVHTEITGCLTGLVTAVQTNLRTAASRHRRHNPAELPQPQTQWPTKQPRSTPFAGYNPQPRKAARNESLAVAARTGRVLQSTRVLDGTWP